MCVHCRNRALVIGLVLSASGILTCAMALAEIFLPRGTTIAVLVSIPLFGAAALGVLVAFAWTCELLDRHGGLYLAARMARTARSVSFPRFLRNPRRHDDAYGATRFANDRLGI